MNEPPIDTRTAEERAESYRYWASRTSAERFEETCRLSIERYGMPVGNRRDGPVIQYQRNPDGTSTMISERYGSNPLRQVARK